MPIAAQTEDELYARYPGVDTELIQQLLSYCSVEEAEGILQQMAGEAAAAAGGDNETSPPLKVARPASAKRSGREPVSAPGSQLQPQQRGTGAGVRRSNNAGAAPVDSSDDDEVLARRLAAEDVSSNPTHPSGRPVTSRTRKQLTEDEAIARQLDMEERLREQRSSQPQHHLSAAVKQRGSSNSITPSPNLSSMGVDGQRPNAPPPFEPEADELSESASMTNDKPTGSAYGDVSQGLHERLGELWKLVDDYQPESIALEPKLKCFIPDFLPAVGDIDPMLKIPEPTPLPAQLDPRLGFRFLDEPNIEQSDPTIVSFELKAQQKTATTTIKQQPVHSIAVHTQEGTKHLAQWCQNILDLHTKKMPDRVVYSKRMPGVESLMEAWADAAVDENDVQRLEDAAKKIVDWDGAGAGLDALPLPDLVRLACAVMDIPLREDKAVNSRCAVESLHLLFSVYAEFKNSQHFGKM